MRYRFAELTLDLEAGRLEGPDGELPLRPQTFRLLAVLVEEAPRVLSQDELLDRVWGAEHLSSNSVRQAVSELRSVLGDSANRPQYIATVHRRGYRFVADLLAADLEREEEALPAAPQAAPQPPRPGSALPPSSPAPNGYETRPAQRRSPALSPTLILAATLITLAVLAGAWWWTSADSEPEPATTNRPSLAVLPFANLGLGDDERWMGSAVAEVLRFELATAGQLRLVPGETVARMSRELQLERLADYGGETLAAVGSNLGVEWVLAGAYLPVTGSETGELLLQAQVQRTDDAAVIGWAQETCTPDELAPAAARLARALQTSLGLATSAEEAAGLWMPDTHTLRLYSQALELLRRKEAEEARVLLEQALHRSPDNPLIHDALSTAYGFLGFDARARDLSRLALEHGEDLPRSLRLAIEARALALEGQKDEAVARWQALWQFYPDEAEHGLELAQAQRAAGRYQEALETLDALRSTLPAAQGDPRISRLESDLFADLGDFAISRDKALQAIEEAAQRGTPLLAVDAHRSHAWALGRLGDKAAALAALERAEALSVQMRNPLGRIFALCDRAQVLQRLGRLDEAEAIYREVLVLLRQRGTRKAEALTLNNFASLLASRGDLPGAREVLERSVELKREIGDSRGLVTSLTNLSNVHRFLGDLTAAAAYLEESVEQARQLGLPEQLGASLRSLAYLRLREERFEVARALFNEALEVSASEEAKAETRFGLATLARKTGELEEAQRHFEQLVRDYRRLEAPESLAHTFHSLGEVQLLRGEPAASRNSFEEVMTLARSLESSMLEAYAHFGLGRLAEENGELATAETELRRALDLFLEVGDEERIEECRAALARLKA
ncbi:MAG: tetratricopeptide repeat protein [Acidobacteriota bacterium]|nr:tetratricopeptide repeat protein [Acidobacteriota bacterium]